MGFDDGRVYLDRQHGSFFAGEVVSGRLVFHQDKVKTFRGIYLKAKGFCDVHWTTSHSRSVSGPDGQRRTENYTKHHNSHEVYFEQKIYLVGKDHGEHHLNPGNHEFPFQCLIPPHCPSSYEGTHGHIRYEFKFVVDRSLKFDQEKSIRVEVVAKRDLNADPYCKQPMEFEFHESYCCWCVRAGSCTVEVSLPASGYVPGQAIPVEVSCDNKSTVEIEAIKLELKEETTFRATHEPASRTEKSSIAKIKKGPVPANTSRRWAAELEVPIMDVRNLDACKFIDVDYEFHVEVCPDGCHDDSSGSRKIVLGHVPLREFENSAPPPEHAANQTSSQHYPGADTQYPGTNPQYPGTNQYPGANPGYPGPIPQYPGTNQYPGANPGYPGPNPQYPGNNPGYPGANPGYPGPNQPNPAHPFPGFTPSPYPGHNPPGGNPPPYPGTMPQFPGAPPPFPGPVFQPSPYFESATDKDGMKVPMVKTGAGVPYSPAFGGPNLPAASAPEPATPGSEIDTPAYNPDFVKDETKPH